MRLTQAQIRVRFPALRELYFFLALQDFAEDVL